MAHKQEVTSIFTSNTSVFKGYYILTSQNVFCVLIFFETADLEIV